MKSLAISKDMPGRSTVRKREKSREIGAWYIKTCFSPRTVPKVLSWILYRYSGLRTSKDERKSDENTRLLSTHFKLHKFTSA